MRYFNTSGPCDLAKHYTVMREALIATGQTLVDEGRYFTLFAPRQAGKTTYFQLLFPHLRRAGYTPIWISFEAMKTLSRADFYKAVQRRLYRELAQYQITVDRPLKNQDDLQTLFENLRPQAPTVVLVIDEFEGVPAEVLSELMHAFRELYQQKQYHALHALMLVGVSTIAELVVSSASPFNVVDELQLPYFTFDEVQNLIQQYVTESGQPFEAAVIKAIL